MKKSLIFLTFLLFGINAHAAQVESQLSAGYVVTMCLADIDAKNDSNLKDFRQEVLYAANACSWDTKKIAPLKNNIIQKQPFRAAKCAEVLKPLMCDPANAAGPCCKEQSYEGGGMTNIREGSIEEKSYHDEAIKKMIKNWSKQAKAAS